MPWRRADVPQTEIMDELCAEAHNTSISFSQYLCLRAVFHLRLCCAIFVQGHQTKTVSTQSCCSKPGSTQKLKLIQTKRALNLSEWLLISVTTNLSSYSCYPSSFWHLLLLLKSQEPVLSVSLTPEWHFFTLYLLFYWRVNACLSNLIIGHLKGLCKIKIKNLPPIITRCSFSGHALTLYCHPKQSLLCKLLWGACPNTECVVLFKLP